MWLSGLKSGEYLLLEKREAADLAEESEDKLFSTIISLFGEEETATGEAGTLGTTGAEIEAAAAALVEDIFIYNKNTGFRFGKKTKRKRASVNLLKSSAAVPNIVMSFARSSTA
jgi:hypothetical protein